MIDSGLVGRKDFFNHHILVRSHEERRWLFEEPTQSRVSPSILYHTKRKTPKGSDWSHAWAQSCFIRINQPLSKEGASTFNSDVCSGVVLSQIWLDIGAISWRRSHFELWWFLIPGFVPETLSMDALRNMIYLVTRYTRRAALNSLCPRMEDGMEPGRTCTSASERRRNNFNDF